MAADEPDSAKQASQRRHPRTQSSPPITSQPKRNGIGDAPAMTGAMVRTTDCAERGRHRQAFAGAVTDGAVPC